MERLLKAALHAQGTLMPSLTETTAAERLALARVRLQPLKVELQRVHAFSLGLGVLLLAAVQCSASPKPRRSLSL